MRRKLVKTLWPSLSPDTVGRMLGYFAKLEHAAHRLLDDVTKESEAVSLSYLLTELERMKNEIVKAIGEGEEQ